MMSKFLSFKKLPLVFMLKKMQNISTTDTLFKIIVLLPFFVKIKLSNHITNTIPIPATNNDGNGSFNNSTPTKEPITMPIN